MSPLHLIANLVLIPVTIIICIQLIVSKDSLPWWLGVVLFGFAALDLILETSTYYLERQARRNNAQR